MASNKSTTAASSSNRPTAEEMQKFYTENFDKLSNFENAEKALTQLTDVTRTTTKTISVFNKENLNAYLQNIGSNERNLRNLSWYLYYRSQIYRLLVNYRATMFDLNSRIVIPSYDITGNNSNDDQMLKSFYDTSVVLDNMNLPGEFLKIYITCFVQDVFYGIVYYDDTGLFILPLPADYCKIAGRYHTGDFAFAFDLGYFRGANEYLLEYYGEPFESMYRTYQNDNDQRWQIVPEEYAICLKQGIEDWQTIVPPFSGLFNELINLEDTKDVQAIADKQEIYKMIWLELETLSGAKQSDQWAVDPTVAIKYFNRMINEALPDYMSAAIIPGKLNTISFDNDKVSDTNKVSKATETVLNSSGGAQILNSSSISGTTAFQAAILKDTREAISSLLPQTQAWVNRFMEYQVSNHARIKFFELSWYTKENFRKQLLENGQYGLPTKLAINSLNGISELETLSLNHFEEDVLKLSDKFSHPLSSSFTSTSTTEGTDPVTGGRPQEEVKTDDGEASEEKADNAK